MEGVMDQEASEGSGSNRMKDYCKKRKNRRRGSKRWNREQKNERWMLQAEFRKELKELLLCLILCLKMIPF